MTARQTRSKDGSGRDPLIIRLKLDPHRFQTFARGMMSVVSMERGSRQRHFRPDKEEQRGQLTIHCQLFGHGREDWNRGLREPRGTIVRSGWLTRLSDGAICLHGLPAMDLRLDASQIERIRCHGLRIFGADFEVEIDAPSFRQALSALPTTARIVPLLPRR
jgi:hypothetical protein